MSHSARSYDAEQTTVQALVLGERGARHMRRPPAMDGQVPPEPRMAGGGLGAMAAVHILVHCPVFRVAFTEFAVLLT
ncbi:hypothetical protein [Desulfosporosinus sp. SB140]|uniref:hypothetical protein n=1 Tax=Desulfosporosinus paludis TaxID=3115649 RepID=UPI00389076C0